MQGEACKMLYSLGHLPRSNTTWEWLKVIYENLVAQLGQEKPVLSHFRTPAANEGRGK